MPWLQLRINSTPSEAPDIEEAASRAGALAVTMEDNADQPIFEPAIGETPLWKETRISALFDAEVNTQSKLVEIETAYKQPLADASWHLLEDKDWEREWMQHFKPIQCGPNLWICPSWLKAPQPSAVNVLLDPGLAFGTGTHPTTFLCMAWLAEQDLKQKEVIDFGCGSGILGVASLLLGAERATGVDIDPQALLATRENTIRNKLPSECFPVFFPDKCPAGKVDIVLANILAGPLVELADKLCNLLKTDGKLCLSGVLQSQYPAIEQAYKNKIKILNLSHKEDWICISGVKL